MLKLIFNRYEKQFIQFLNKKQGIKLTKDNLSFSFYDSDGLGYYKFPKEMALPMVRLGKLMGYMKLLSAGISGDELEEMIVRCEGAIAECIKSNKNWAKIGWALSEIRDRKQLVIHDELFYNIIAVQMIRHDENPTEFNNDIQMQKVESFRKLNEGSDTFFLNISEYLRALNWSNITREELQDILKNSIIHRQATSEMLEKVFGSLSEEQKKTLSSL